MKFPLSPIQELAKQHSFSTLLLEHVYPVKRDLLSQGKSQYFWASPPTIQTFWYVSASIYSDIQIQIHAIHLYNSKILKSVINYSPWITEKSQVHKPQKLKW